MLRPALFCVALALASGCSREAGPADACELLRAADPRALLRDELSAELRIYGLCRVESLAAPGGPDERSAGLEIRRDREAAAVGTLQEFWEREGNGVAFQGGAREQGVELNGPGRYTIYFPITGGVLLYSYWEDDHLLVVTVKGAPVERALPWAQDLAGETVRAERASRS